MYPFSKDALEELIRRTNGPHVSIYIPTHRAGAEIQQDRIRLKNLLVKAEEILIEGGMRAPDVSKMLLPARNRVEDTAFWRDQRDGLAAFLSSAWSQVFSLPLHFNEDLVVGDRFHIKPLLPLLSGDGQFFILALSLARIKLFHASRESIEEVDLESVPGSLNEALRFDDPERRLQFHTQSDSPVSTTDRDALFHGHGVGADNAQKERILRFFHHLDRGLHAYLHDETMPLILAGVDYLHPIYREANSYPFLTEEGIVGNPEEKSAQELHNQAWEVVAPYFQRERQTLASQYKDLSGTDRSSDKLAHILPAAFRGQIHVLFVQKEAQIAGTYEPHTGKLIVHEERKVGDEDLLDLAAIKTLIYGGKVYAVLEENMPSESAIAAIFRYESESAGR